jgi:hypothetical protein
VFPNLKIRATETESSRDTGEIRVSIDTSSPYMTVPDYVYQRVLHYITSTPGEEDIDTWRVGNELYCQCTPSKLRAYPRFVMELGDGVELEVHAEHLYI